MSKNSAPIDYRQDLEKCHALPTRIDFRRHTPQTVNLPWAGPSVVTYLGKCPITGVGLYDCDTGNDPRGPLGWHAAYTFEASEYDCEGPDFIASWIACNNDVRVYLRALALAKQTWKEKTP